MKFLTLAAAAAFSVLAQVTFAHEFKVGDLVIHHPMAFDTAQSAMSGAGYLTVTNNGTNDDRLIAVEAAFPRVMMHESAMKDGVATMSHVDAIAIPAGESVALAPGGFHIMFMGLDGDPFEVGEKIPATLVFEHAGKVEVMFNVEERNADAMDHSVDGAGH